MVSTLATPNKIVNMAVLHYYKLSYLHSLWCLFEVSCYSPKRDNASATPLPTGLPRCLPLDSRVAWLVDRFP